MPDKKILIIDDDSINIFALSAFLVPMGYKCTAALSGVQCLKILSGRPHFDYILMDIMMPEMDGIETIKQIRKIVTYKNTKIVVITADDSSITRLKSITAGANAVLNKPVDTEKLEKFLN